MFVNYSTSSGQKTATAQIWTSTGSLSGVDLTPPASGQASLLIYDSENSNLTNKVILAELLVDAGTVGINHEFYAPVGVNRGIYCVLTQTMGTDCRYYVRYSAG